MEVEFRIDVEINGYSEDGRFFHSYFKISMIMNGNHHLAHLDLAFGLINDTILRKLTSMPECII